MAAQSLSIHSTYPIPLIHATAGPLSSVLDLLELADRHSAECEELAMPLAEGPGGQCSHMTYAGHDSIGNQSLERDAHGCGGGRVAGLLWRW